MESRVAGPQGDELGQAREARAAIAMDPLAKGTGVVPRRRRRVQALAAAAEASSTSAAFCWVTSSITVTVWLTCSMPRACSRVAALMSATIAATSRADAMMPSMVPPAACTCSLPWATCATDSPISALISFAACAER